MGQLGARRDRRGDEEDPRVSILILVNEPAGGPRPATRRAVPTFTCQFILFCRVRAGPRPRAMNPHAESFRLSRIKADFSELGSCCSRCLGLRATGRRLRPDASHRVGVAIYPPRARAGYSRQRTKRKTIFRSRESPSPSVSATSRRLVAAKQRTPSA